MLGSPLNPQHFILAGEVVDTLRTNPTGAVKIVKSISMGSMDVNTFMDNVAGKSTSSDQSDYQNIAGASLDSLFVPFTTATSHDRLPSFTAPTGDQTVSSEDLNPFNPQTLYTLDSGNFLEKGHNIGLAVHGDSVGASESGDFAFEKDYAARGGVNTAVRAIAHRAPMVLSGWGFTEAGNPVPHATGDESEFHPEAFHNPKFWKTGPLDVRWDDNRGVWAAGGAGVTVHLVKTTNVWNPSCFSYEVDRAVNASQYTRNTLDPRVYTTGNFPETNLSDPELEAYNANSSNSGCFERLDFTGIEYPYYEAFIIRSTSEEIDSSVYYNIWTQDCQDCGHVANACGPAASGSATGKKILIENPLRQSLDVGDLAFTVDTGRTKKVNSGGFSGGSGAGAAVTLTSSSSGTLQAGITSGGTGYTAGAFAIISDLCGASITLTATSGVITSAVVGGITSGYPASQTYSVTVVPKDVTALEETLPIHWIIQAEFKSQQVVTHVECQHGILQTCTQKIQTQGFKSCEHCGEDTTLVNNYL